MPGARRSHYLITYDIASDSRRTRLSRLLEGYGDRVQYSVFEADLSRKDVQDILRSAENLVSKGDSLRLYPACENCAGKVKTIGRSYQPGGTLRIV
jgi:CRISPR-associated protein Cas2